MAPYFFHLRGGTDEVLDDEGVDYDTFDLLKQAVPASAGDLLCGDLKRG